MASRVCEWCAAVHANGIIVYRFTLDRIRRHICDDCWAEQVVDSFIPVLKPRPRAKWAYVLLTQGQDDSGYRVSVLKCATAIPRLFLCEELVQYVKSLRWARFHSAQFPLTDNLSDEEWLKRCETAAEYFSPVFSCYTDLWDDVWDHSPDWRPETIFKWKTIDRETCIMKASRSIRDCSAEIPPVVDWAIKWENGIVQIFQQLQSEMLIVLPIVFQCLGPQFAFGRSTHIRIPPFADPADFNPVTQARQVLKRYAQGWEETDRLIKRSRAQHLLPLLKHSSLNFIT